MDKVIISGFFCDGKRYFVAVKALPEFCNLFATVELCEQYLIKVRWPNGFICPRCGGKRGYPIQKRAIIECAISTCRYHASLTAGAVMHRSKQDLQTWFWAAYLVVKDKGRGAMDFKKPP